MSGSREKPESLEVDSRRVLVVTAALLLLVAGTALGFTLIFHNRIGTRFVPHTDFPAPAVIVHERAQRLALEARQRKDLAGAHGRMPIEEAMRQIAARGAHAFDPVP
jgi:hypothetical protein